MASSSLSYADRVKKAHGIPTTEPQKPQKPLSAPLPPKQAPANVWDRRKEELAARKSSAEDEHDDDDPFVVRSSRAPPHPQITDSAEDWPQIGKQIPHLEPSKQDPVNGDRKTGPPKWVPLSLQAPAELQPQSQPAKSNRQSPNHSRPTSNGQGRNSRSHSGRNSANQSRIHSNSGSTNSSPRANRNRRLPPDDLPPSTMSRSSRTGSPPHVNSSQGNSPFPISDIASQSSNYSGFLSPPSQGHSPYYPQQLPSTSSPLYHSPAHGPPLSLQPDPSLPMSSYSYQYPNPYLPYEYMPAVPSYSYWGGHHSHPSSGSHSPAYPPPSSYPAVLPLHVQQHFYPQPVQPQLSSQSNSSAVSGAPPNTSDQNSIETENLLMNSGSPNISVMKSPTIPVSVDSEPPETIGHGKQSASVVFGSIEPSLTPLSLSTTTSVEGESIEKSFRLLAIGVDPTEVATKPRKPTKPQKSNSEKEDHQSSRVVNGEIAVDPALQKEVEASSAGETKWKFGNDGLGVSSGAGDAADLSSTTAEGLGTDFQVKNFGFGFGLESENAQQSVVDSSKDEEIEGVVSKEAPDAEQQPGEREDGASNYQPQPGYINGRPRRGGYTHDRGNYVGGRRRGGMNSYRGYRGYGGGRGGNHMNNFHVGNGGYRQQSSFNNTPPPPHFQGISHHPHAHADYYGPPRPPPLSTYVPYEPYPPPPLASSSTASVPQTPLSPAPQTSSGHGHAAPPLPMPLSQLGFPLDSTRFYLLGQLEYYLSPQNMAQDLFLRRRMDSRGWIEISLLASFNRITQLTRDYGLVKDVLMLSTCVQVRQDWARMVGWEQFVLPDASTSTVETEEGEGEGGYSSAASYVHPHPYPDAPEGQWGGGVGGDGGITGLPVPGVLQDPQQPQQWNPHSNGNGNGTGEEEEEAEVEEEEEEEDVVFVMEQNGAEGMTHWSHKSVHDACMQQHD